jgi:flagellar biosynthesis protein FlgN
MNPARPAPTELAKSLSVEVAEFQALLALLCNEQEALRIADADALALIARDKLTRVHALQGLGAVRARALRERALEANADGMRALLGECAQSEHAREDWDTLVGMAAHALRQNALNARLAHVQQQHVDRAMEALWRAAGCEATYGADGRSRHNAPRRPLAAI